MLQHAIDLRRSQSGAPAASTCAAIAANEEVAATMARRRPGRDPTPRAAVGLQEGSAGQPAITAAITAVWCAGIVPRPADKCGAPQGASLGQDVACNGGGEEEVLGQGGEMRGGRGRETDLYQSFRELGSRITS